MGGLRALVRALTGGRKPKRRNLDAFTDSRGVVHPIRGSAGYDDDKTTPGGAALQQFLPGMGRRSKRGRYPYRKR